MIVTIHQPEYLPYLGFFDRIEKADIFVILDDVQYQKGGFINRNKIKTSQGWQWLTVPIKEKESLRKIFQVEIDNQIAWEKNHWKAIFYNYQRAPYFKKYANFFQKVFQKKWKKIVNLDVYLIKQLLSILGIRTKLYKSSQLNVQGKGTARLVNLCQKLKAYTYLSGPGGKRYLDLTQFEEKKIKVIFQDFSHPVYPQRFEKIGFIPNLSIVDLLFNCGPKSLDIIKGYKKYQ